MMYELPVSVKINETEYSIRSDYRAVLDICTALSDPELDQAEKILVLLEIFYPDFETIPADCCGEAVQKCFWFINCGGEEDKGRKAPKLMDWEQDFQYLVSPINRVVGKEIRSVEYLHWWTFISAYYEIGDCLFAQIVRIRSLKARGKPLEKSDREWYQQNRCLVDLKTTFTSQEEELLSKWIR